MQNTPLKPSDRRSSSTKASTAQCRATRSPIVWLTVFVLLVGVRSLCPAALATEQTTLRPSLATGSLPAPNGWAIVRIPLPPAAADHYLQISIRDGRGGPRWVRTVTPPATSALIALPYVQPSTLPPAQWPVTIGVRRIGKPWILQAAAISLPQPSSASTFIIAIPHRLQQHLPTIAAWLQELQPAHAMAMALLLSRQHLYSASPLVLAGCKAVVITRRIAHDMSPKRLAALLCADVHFYYWGRNPPAWPMGPSWRLIHSEDSASGHLIWELGKGLTCIPPPTLINAKLADWHIGAPHAPGRWFWPVILYIPTMLLLLWAATLLTTKPIKRVAAFAVLTALTTLAAGGWLAATARPASTRMAWTTTCASARLRLIQQYDLLNPIRPASIRRTTAQGLPPLPLVITAQDYFNLHATITLSRSSGTLRMHLAAAPALIYLRRAAAAGIQPPMPTIGTIKSWRQAMRSAHWKLHRTYFISRGHVFNALYASGLSFGLWCSHLPQKLSHTMALWFRTAWRLNHLYVIELPPQHGTAIDILDYGQQK